ncbi:hypothetical protein XFF6991_450061 [Xanthomonas phaseoli pv. phaseoli]|uniref:Uncharacterized protein n=1 Tax=Xanthomonas campestris pv. phaseoli TaxID=317013 RepID=A0A7Z7NIL2_XANCH|nr:hypothetical protein XFF6991_450061 [Xanthomonas phaseoli pv. phaseoli]
MRTMVLGPWPRRVKLPRWIDTKPLSGNSPFSRQSTVGLSLCGSLSMAFCRSWPGRTLAVHAATGASGGPDLAGAAAEQAVANISGNRAETERASKGMRIPVSGGGGRCAEQDSTFATDSSVSHRTLSSSPCAAARFGAGSLRCCSRGCFAHCERSLR